MSPFFPFSSAWRSDRCSKVFLYAIYYLNRITQQAGEELSHLVSSLKQHNLHLKRDWEFSCPNLWLPIPGADTEVTLQPQYTNSIFTVPFFHANIAVTFQRAQFCFVRLLSITPDPSRQSLNSSELQPFPEIQCQVTQLNSHTVWCSQQLPHPFPPSFEVWGFYNLLFHKRQLVHLMF